MNDLTQEELQFILILRNLKPFEVIELKLDDKQNVIYTYTKKERYVILTH